MWDKNAAWAASSVEDFNGKVGQFQGPSKLLLLVLFASELLIFVLMLNLLKRVTFVSFWGFVGIGLMAGGALLLGIDNIYSFYSSRLALSSLYYLAIHVHASTIYRRRMHSQNTNTVTELFYQRKMHAFEYFC